jgi:hypothetical protein
MSFVKWSCDSLLSRVQILLTCGSSQMACSRNNTGRNRKIPSTRTPTVKKEKKRNAPNNTALRSFRFRGYKYNAHILPRPVHPFLESHAERSSLSQRTAASPPHRRAQGTFFYPQINLLCFQSALRLLLGSRSLSAHIIPV